MFEYDHTPARGRQHGSASPGTGTGRPAPSRPLARPVTRALSLATGVIGTYLIAAGGNNQSKLHFVPGLFVPGLLCRV